MSTATAVRERPIIFDAESVRAILDGRKTQTRRVIKPQPEHIEWFNFQNGWCARVAPHYYEMVACPYGVEGDRLWVRERWAEEEESPNDGDHRTWRWVHYRATPHTGYRVEPTRAQCTYLHESAGPERVAQHVAAVRWRSPIFMPRWASRITLEITEVRVQRLQDIRDDDARAEAVDVELGRAFSNFLDRWDSINGKRALWKSNPWVWAITFRVVS